MGRNWTTMLGRLLRWLMLISDAIPFILWLSRVHYSTCSVILTTERMRWRCRIRICHSRNPYWTLTLVTTCNCDSVTDLHTPKITVTTAHIKSSQSSLAVAWWRLPTADVPFPLGSRTGPGLSHFSQPQLSNKLRESELLWDWQNTAHQYVLATSPLRLITSDFCQLNPYDECPYVTSPLTRKWVCNLQLLLGLARAVILDSESRGTHDHILRLRFETPSTWRPRSPYLYHPGTRWPSYAPRYWVLFSSPLTTRKATVEVFEHASTRATDKVKVKIKVTLLKSVASFHRASWLKQ
jgi:hypothetical protein